MRSRALLSALLLATVAVAGFVLWRAPDGESVLHRPPAEESRADPSTEHAPVLEGTAPATEPNSEPDAPRMPTTGRIVWPDGAPYRDPRGVLFIEREGQKTRTTRLTASGGFRFEAVPGRMHTVWLFSPGKEADGHWEVKGGARDVALTLPTGRDVPFVALRIEDEAGRAVRWARVRIHALGDFGPLEEEAIKVKEGWVRRHLEFAARRILVDVYDAADLDGQRLAATAFGPLRVDRSPHVLRLGMGRPWTMRIVNPDGEGIGGVKVEADQRPPLLTWVGDFHRREATTDADGRCTFEAAGPGPYEVAVHPPHPWLRPADVTVRDPAREMTFELQRGVMAVVHVLDPDGRPIRACRIEVRPDEHLRQWTTSRYGKVTIGPLEGDVGHRLYVEHPGAAWLGATLEAWTPADTTVRLEPNEEPASPEPRAPEEEPEPEGATLRLRIHTPRTSAYGDFPDGALIGSDRVEVSFPSPRYDRGSGGYLVTRELEGLDAETTYTLRVAGIQDGWALEAEGLRPGPTVHDLTLTRGLVIRGHLDLPADTDYVSIDATCGALNVTSVFAGATVLSDGRFEIPGLVSGTWHLDVSARARNLWFDAEVDVEAGGEARIRLERSAGN